MSTILVLKLVLVPSLIWAATVASRRWGPTVGGWLSAFPVISAPILYIIALEHGSAFAADAALGTFSAVLANVAFGISYAWVATRFSWAPGLVAGFAGYFLVVACLGFWTPSLYLAVPVVLAGLVIAPRLYPSVPSPAQVPSRPANDLLWRMGAGALLVLLITHFASTLGPQLSGALAMFPVMASVLAVFSHRHSGPAFAVRILRGMALGYYAFGTFCIVLMLALPMTTIGLAFLISLGGAVLVHAISRIHLRHAHPATPESGQPPSPTVAVRSTGR